ncbi:MAG: Short-chain dehydrogenase/reductase [Myxococcales bacterium]|nr:Short-chain dehydrogenase/reductase [Myxococcales bacterium]
MIIITGATGHLGKHVVQQLLTKVPASQVAVAVRDVAKGRATFTGTGVEIRHADYSKPETLEGAFKGADKVLLISSSEVGQRATQHLAVIAAARRAGVKLLAYTSILHADHAKISLAAEHKATEEAIQASGIPYVILRNGWYTENYTEHLAPALAHGAIAGSAQEGKIAAATRADFAGAAVEVLTGSGHENKIYELVGDTAFTMAELAGEVARQSGKPVVYQDLPADAYKSMLISVGLPEPVAGMLADADLAIARGELVDSSSDLQKLLGRPTTSLKDAVAAGLRA